MLKRSLIACLLIAAGAFAQSTKPTTQPVDAAAVAELVTHLGADDAAARDTARQKLAALGTPVAPELQKAMAATSDPEVRSSLQAVINDLANADRSVPTLVTLNLKGVSPKTAVETIAEQTGVEIGVWPDWVWRNVKKNVTIAADKQPFWVVMNDICNQAGLSPESHGSMGKARITLSQSNPGKTFTSWYGDGFLALPRNASRTHTIDYSQPKQKQESFGLNVRVLVDPRIRVLRGPRLLIANEAIDDKGNSLLAKQHMSADDNLDAPSFGCAWLWDLSAALKYLPEQGQTLKSFKTKAVFEVAEKQEVWEIDATKAAKAEKTFNGTKITIQDLTRQGDTYEVKLVVSWKEPKFGFGNRRENPLGEYNTVQSMIKLVDAQGHSYENRGGGGGGGGAGSANFTFNYSRQGGDNPVGDAAKLILSVPTGTRKVELPIEFKDLPIP